MKKISCKAAVVLLVAGSMLTTSCIGSFSLFNKYEDWQCHMTSNKFVNAIVGFVLQPIVGGVCLFVDSVVLNTIEFWSGSNPVASTGKTQQVMGQDGRYYAVKTLKDGYRVTAPTGEVTVFTHDAATDSWSMSQDGVTKEIFRFNADGTIQATLSDGETITVTADEAGVQQVREAVLGDALFFAAN